MSGSLVCLRAVGGAPCAFASTSLHPSLRVWCEDGNRDKRRHGNKDKDCDNDDNHNDNDDGAGIRDGQHVSICGILTPLGGAVHLMTMTTTTGVVVVEDGGQQRPNNNQPL